MTPEAIPTLRFYIGPQGKNTLSADARPAHAATAQAGLDDGLAGRLDRSVADRQAPTPKRGIVHSLLVSPEEGAFLRQGFSSCFPQPLPLAVVIQRTQK